MDISFGRVKEIAESLPIGFYAKEKIELIISNDEQVSYYAPLENKIVISYSTILQALRKINDNDPYVETAVRSVLYHEVSHAILTPTDLQITNIINIFEDERIETLLANYYYNVNFKENIFLLNDYQGEAPTNAIDEFYQTVRYRIGEDEFLQDVSDIITKYSKMSETNYERYTWYYNECEYDIGCNNYTSDIYELYNKIAQKWNEKPKYYSEDLRSNDSSGLNGDLLNPIESNSDNVGDFDIEKAIEKSQEEVSKVKPGTPTDELVNSVINTYYDIKLTAGLENIINTFNKKNNSGAAIAGYSGVFDPRAVAREDYRYFKRKASVNGNNTFGTLHLNLFLDDSGSMSCNEVVVNKLLYSLICIERSNKNFTFDVITCANRIAIVDKYKGYKADGGTYLSKKIIPIYRAVQKPNTYNYNLVLFDGSATTDTYLNGNTFGIFDNNRSTIISDFSNSRKLDNLKNATIIYSDRYTEELIDNVFKTLQQAFR